MASNTVTLKYLLLAQDQASKILKSTGKTVDETGKKVGGMSTGMKVGLLAAGGAAVGFATASINKFKQVTAESRGLQRALGGTLEEASRMREAAILSGVDYGTFQKSINKLDKALVASSDGGKKHAAMVQLLGQDYIDATGHIEPMNKLMPKLADKFAAMADGPEKTALSMQLFGKAGTQMLPFLSRGAAGIADLEKQSDKFGTTLSGSAIEALAKNKEESRKWSAAMDGLKVQIGAQLLPIMNSLVGFIQDHVIPIFQAVTGFIKDHKDMVMIAVTVIGTLIVGLKAWAIAQGILNVVMSTNPIALVVIAIAALAAGLIYAYKHSETFRRVVQQAFSVIKTVISAVWNYYIKPIFLAWKLYFTILGTAAMWLWRNVISPAFNGIKAAVMDAWHVIGNVFAAIRGGIRWVRDVVKPVVAIISNLFKGMGGGLQWAWSHVIKPLFAAIMAAVNTVKTAVQDVVNTFSLSDAFSSQDIANLRTKARNQWIAAHPGQTPPARAHGGGVSAGMPYIVGDGGRAEIFVPDSSGHIIPSVGRGRGGGNTYITVQVQGSVISENQLAAALKRAANRGFKVPASAIQAGR